MISPELQSKLTILNTVMLSGLLIMGIMENCDSKSRTDTLTPDVVNLRPSTSGDESQPDTVTSNEGNEQQQIVNEPNPVVETTEELALQISAPTENITVMTVAELLEATIGPLRAAGSDHEEDVLQFIPTQEELEAANASESLESEASKIVLAKIAKGYEQFNMPFPSLPTAPLGSGGSKGGTQTIGFSGPANSSEGGASRDPAAVRSYLLPTIERLQTELSLNGMNDNGFIPSETELSAAINSGLFTSDESLAVLNKLRTGFVDCGLDFPEPGSVGIGETAPPPTKPKEPTGASGNGAAGPPPDGAGGGSTFDQQEVIVRAYFEGQIQRVKMLAEQSGTDVSELLPVSSDIDAAAKTGKIESAESRLAIEKLASAYALLEQPFNPPISEQQ